MKKNFVSAIAGWKSAALLALVAMVAAVAFSGVLSTTQTADAQASPVRTAAGGSVNVTFDSHALLAIRYGGDAVEGVAPSTWLWTVQGTELTVGADTAGVDASGNLRALVSNEPTGSYYYLNDAAPVALATSPVSTTYVDSEGNLRVRDDASDTPDDDDQYVGRDGTAYDAVNRSGSSLYSVDVSAGLGDSTAVTTVAQPARGSIGAERFRFRITADSTAGATFAANGSKSLRCADDASPGGIPNCDRSDLPGTITVRVDIDADSPLGEVFVQVYKRNPSGDDTNITEHDIEVIRANPPTDIRPGSRVTPVDAAGDTPLAITVSVVNAGGRGVEGIPLSVTTTGGLLATTADGCAANGSDRGRGVCTATSGSDGSVTVSLFGNGAAGQGTVTFRNALLNLTHSVDIVLYGAVASITADAEQSSVQVGGSTFIVVTATDSNGNPVVGATADRDVNAADHSGGITSPGAPPVKVEVNNAVDKHPASHALHIPACGTGTNAAGKCVIQITAPAHGPGPADDATRGTHTVTVKAAGLARDADKVAVDISVSGAPSEISTKAPPSVDTLSSTEVVISVVDDEGESVGAVTYTVDQVEGEGKITSGATVADDPSTRDTNEASMTSDGQAKFTYLAPSGSDTAVFYITAGTGPGTISHTVEIVVGAASAPESATWNKELVSGQNLVVWNGADGADPSEGAADGVSSIWSYDTGAGSWDGYFPNAADVPGGNTLTSLSNGDAYFVVVD